MVYDAPSTTLLPIPSDDLVLGSLANHVAAETGREPLALQRVLRRAFPYVHVQIQHELAQFGSQRAWYVYRDGWYQLAPQPEWWRRAGLSHVSFDENGRFVDVDEAAADLFALARRDLLGRTWSDFFAPELSRWFDSTMAALRDERTFETKWLLYRADGAETYAELRYVRQGLAPRCHTAVVGEVRSNLLFVPTIEAARVPVTA
jgi:PAS domain S-box-containing protein